MGDPEPGGATRGERSDSFLRRAGDSYATLIVAGLALGLLVAPAASDAVLGESSGTVAVVPLSGAIDGPNARSVVDRLERAEDDPEVDAVVLWINSGGGGAAPSESIYLEVRRLAERVPVVASVGSMAASGAYYATAPADAIYAKPSSLVGSVGVYTTVPKQYEPIEGVVQSGPNKLGGADRREWYYKTEAVTRAFLNAVESNRGDRLALTREELAFAKLYTGSESVANGLADGIGGLDAAVRRAAREAGLDGHEVRVFGYGSGVDFLVRSNYVASNASEKRLIAPATFVGSPSHAVAPNVLMLPPSVVRSAATAPAPEAGNETEVRPTATP